MIISDRQRAMLKMLAKVKSHSVASMVVDLEIGRAHYVLENIKYNFNELCLKGLAQVDTDRRQGVGYCITPEGLAAAINCKAKPAPVVVRRIGPMQMPRYVPPTWGYMRTDNNKQYQSRGFQ